ncbi:MAG: hypothetical protein J7J71_05710 [Deltaproteobacteria bacterium]|nr:hypothetical protein [Candidatus Tharpella sp.]
MPMKKGVLLIILGVVLLGLISCSGVSVNTDPKVRLQERVEGYIQARQAADQIALQGFYLDPHQARIGNIRYLSSEISAITFSDEDKRAQVKLKNSMQAMGFTFKDTPQTITWVWEKGDWYLVVNKNRNPFAKKNNPPESVKDAVDQKK